jgi:phosphonate transport system substrate-binding protein
MRNHPTIKKRKRADKRGNAFTGVALVLVLTALAVATSGCKRQTRDVRVIDFEDTVTAPGHGNGPDPENTLKVAVSAILSPKETYGSYEELFRYISDKLEMDIEFIQRKTYGEINQMLEGGELDFAFICSGAYIELNTSNGVELLAAPLSKGEPYYQAYVIVPERSEAASFQDLKGGSFAFTDPISNTGHLYALYRIGQIRENEDGFFSSTIFTHGHDISIQMVARGLVDGATIDGLVFDYLEAREPDRVKGIRIIEKSGFFGIPPVVITRRVDEQNRERIRELFLHMHEDSHALAIMNSLLIDRFVEASDEDYNSIRIMRNRSNR